MHASDSILYKVEGRLATITLNRPHRKNALDQSALDDLAERINQAASDENVWVVLINASGPDFCTGQDVKELARGGQKKSDYFEPVYAALKRNYKPTICAVRGLCLAGGAGIAMGSDIRILAESARWGWPHAKIGISSIGAPSTLARMIPMNIALEYMFTGEYMDAPKALALNLANHVVKEEELEAFAQTMVEKILANAPLSTRASKKATLQTQHLPYAEAVSESHKILDDLILSNDAKEGMRAFMEKRSPVWTAS